MSEVVDTPLSERFFAEYPPKKLGNVAMQFTDEPFDITFLLVNHGDDAAVPEATKKLITDSNIILVEGAGWQSSQQAVLNKVSSGDSQALTAPELSNNSFDRALYNQLCGTNKPIKYCDRPYSRKFADEITAIKKYPAGLQTTSSVETAKSILATKYRKTYQSVLGRDKYILSTITRTITSAETNLDKKALFIVGAGHVSLPYVMRRDIFRTGQEGDFALKEVFPYDAIHYGMRLYGEFLSSRPFTEELLLKDMLLRTMSKKDAEQVAVLDELSLDDTRELFAKKVLQH